MYACPNVRTRVNIVHADRNTPGFMRAPPDTPYMFALECAMDELAVELQMDPVELRRVNDTQQDPVKDIPFTARSLMKCFDEAAARFGWDKRDPRPGSMSDGDWLIGWGCASAAYPANIGPASARVTVTPQRTAHVEIAAHEIGTGALTVVAVVAAEHLGLPLESVRVDIGDSALPPSNLAAGSSHTATICHVVAKACDEAGGKMEWTETGAIEVYAEHVPKGMPADSLDKIYQGKTAIQHGNEREDETAYAFGAQFVEVRVHRLTREIRVSRMVGAFAAGTIVNPLTAHSQYMGGMIWGLGCALHEKTEIDERAARYVNDNIAEYLIAVNADVRDVEVIIVPETDDGVNPLGIKGIGEIGIVGVNAAIANAVYHATGRRVRELPIRIEHLL
jgi:xanthine dehydrogenase YagR molybdenum-binding subunit